MIGNPRPVWLVVLPNGTAAGGPFLSRQDALEALKGSTFAALPSVGVQVRDLRVVKFLPRRRRYRKPQKTGPKEKSEGSA